MKASGIPLTEFGPQGAFDCPKPKARDDEPEDAARGLANILLAVKDALVTTLSKSFARRFATRSPRKPLKTTIRPRNSRARRNADGPRDGQRKDKRAKDKKTAKDAPADFPG